MCFIYLMYPCYCGLHIYTLCCHIFPVCGILLHARALPGCKKLDNVMYRPRICGMGIAKWGFLYQYNQYIFVLLAINTKTVFQPLFLYKATFN